MSATPNTNLAPSVTSEPTRLAAGEIVAERYRVVSLLGEGGMGAVYRVEHVHMRKPFALKILHAEISSHPEISARFEREAIAAGHIDHPNVTAATDFGKLADGSFFLVLEYVEGRTLRDELMAQKEIPTLRALRILRGVSVGLAAAHAKGIVHRDLKPENVMLVDRNGEADFVKILDFGIAKVDSIRATGNESGAQPLTRLGAIYGTPDYMSPEQALGQVVDLRTDLYALGVILFEMLSGDRPFHGDEMAVLRDRVLNETAPEMPPEIAARFDSRVHVLLRKLMMRDAGARMQSARELTESIDALLEALAPPVSASSVEKIAEAPKAEHTDAAAVFAHIARDVRDEVVVGLRAAEPHVRARKIPILVGGAVLVLVALVLSLAHRSSSPRDEASSTTVASASVEAIPETSARAAVTTADLPPPPPPRETATSAAHADTTSTTSTSSTKSKSSNKSGRKTGPDGIYIPPPSQWFK